eukprot:15007940-Alexandrium_andersonii.AAC.1
MSCFIPSPTHARARTHTCTRPACECTYCRAQAHAHADTHARTCASMCTRSTFRAQTQTQTHRSTDTANTTMHIGLVRVVLLALPIGRYPVHSWRVEAL